MGKRFADLIEADGIGVNASPEWAGPLCSGSARDFPIRARQFPLHQSESGVDALGNVPTFGSIPANNRPPQAGSPSRIFAVVDTPRAIARALFNPGAARRGEGAHDLRINLPICSARLFDKGEEVVEGGHIKAISE